MTNLCWRPLWKRLHSEYQRLPLLSKSTATFAFDFQLLNLTNLFSTFPQLVWLNNGNHAIIINASLLHIIKFYLFSLYWYRYQPIWNVLGQYAFFHITETALAMTSSWNWVLVSNTNLPSDGGWSVGINQPEEEMSEWAGLVAKDTGRQTSCEGQLEMGA